jgi:peptidoglycan/xylan/chitin deacetylase (PgdA/CDA1 family)
MSVFLDTSNKRKFYFRTSVVVIFATIVFSTSFFIYNLVFGKSLTSPAVKYSETVDSYHYYFSPANKNKIALTFDDGPRPNITKEIARILKNNDAPAIFFFVGQEIFLKPNIVDEVARQGFEIGNHSFTHREDIHSSQNRLSLELRSTSYLISKITGKNPVYYRPPFLLGIGIDPTVNPYLPIPNDVLWSLEDGLIPTGIDIDTRDWMANSSEDVVVGLEKALEKYPDGHIILLHEEAYTVELYRK